MHWRTSERPFVGDHQGPRGERSRQMACWDFASVRPRHSSPIAAHIFAFLSHGACVRLGGTAGWEARRGMA